MTRKNNKSSYTNLDILAEKYEFCGREIKKAVISACLHAAMAEHDYVSQEDFIYACDRIIEEEQALASAKDHTASEKKKNLSPEQENALKTVIKEKLSQNAENNTQVE